MKMEIKDINQFKKSDLAALRHKLDSMNIVDIAAELEKLDRPDAIIAFRILPKDKATEVFVLPFMMRSVLWTKKH